MVIFLFLMSFLVNYLPLGNVSLILLNLSTIIYRSVTKNILHANES